MSKTITIRLDDSLAEMLDLVLDGCQETKSQIIRDALRRQLPIEMRKLNKAVKRGRAATFPSSR
jgi:predicted transcriptional regulator